MLRSVVPELLFGAAVTLLTLAGFGAAQLPGPPSFAAPPGFPTTAFPSYYVPPSPTQEPQPALYDPVLNVTYPKNLTDPNNIPQVDIDPIFYPPALANVSNATAQAFIATAIAQIKEIIISDQITGNCSKCIAALSVGKVVSQVVPQYVPDAMVALCQATGFSSNSTCVNTYAATSSGAPWTTILALADVAGLDGQYICNKLSSQFCPAPIASKLNTTGLFPKPKPKNAKAPKASGKRVKVLHLSDFHLDPRYLAGKEANCTGGICCRANAKSPVNGSISEPAPLYGAFLCDTPYDLASAVLQSIGPLTGTSKEKPFAWGIYTGDLVSHDSQNQLSRAYTEYTETAVFKMFKDNIGGPIFATLGNHDSNPEALDAPHSLPGPLGQQFSWNYNHVADLWKMDGWIDDAAAQQAKLHYAAYSILNQYGIRIISMNSDFWYRNNLYNYINTTNPDASGQFAFLIQELQKAEDAGERVWIINHVLTGWDGSNALNNPSDLFYQIVDRYSPHVIANVFFGHTHEDELMIYYANNATVQNSSTAQTPGWIGPSVVPLTNLNSGFRMYEVDIGDANIYNAYTWYSDVHNYPSLDNGRSGPPYLFEYSTRQAYQPIGGWPEHAPLNATYWHLVTEAMQVNRTLVSQFNTYQGKTSVLSPNCTSDACAQAKICYIRSGSAPIGKGCPQGFGSVQSKYTGKNF